ncbi:MAG TPA: metallophosphoesterase, partial [Sphaerochaeta sp.]|nr:metallophosphoesterase [Sphaerochaeta sp.]
MAVEPAPVVVAPPVVEEVVYPYGVRPIVKNADGNEVFDLFIVHTNDVKGNIYAENGGVGIAKLSTALKAGREITDNWLLLNTGYVGEIPAEAALTAAWIVDELGYDAYLPQAIQIELGIEGTQKAIPLAANVLDAEEYLLFQPYQVYDFNGFTVGVVGIVAPKPVSGVSFDADVILDNAQWAVDIARTYVDYLVVLTDLGEGVFSSSDLAENIQGIDLIVDGSGSETAKVVNDTLIVRAEEQLRSIGGVVVSVDRGRVTGVLPLVLPAEDLAVPYLSPLAAEYEPFANALGYTLMVTLPEDPAIVEQIGPTPEKVAVVVPVPVVKVEEKPAPPPAPAPAPPPAPPAPAPVVEEVVPIKITRPVEPREFPLGVTSIVKNAAGDKDFDLFVVHTNDVHGRITPSDGGMGYSKLATMLEVGRSITDNILVLDAGDVSHGTNLANLFEGEVVGVLLDMLGYDAVVPGNHDFNYGSERLIQAAEFAEEYSNLRVLAANVLDEDGYLVFQPYQVYDFNGFTVGVVGLTTPDTKTKSHPKNTAGLTILNEEIFAIGQQ